MFRSKLTRVAAVLSVAFVAAAGGVARQALAGAEEKPVTPDLKALANGKGGTTLVDATLKWVEDAKGKPALHVRPKKGGAVILLDGIEFTNGVIEFDVLGQSSPPQSNFLGFAFRAVDATTHDAV